MLSNQIYKVEFKGFQNAPKVDKTLATVFPCLLPPNVSPTTYPYREVIDTDTGEVVKAYYQRLFQYKIKPLKSVFLEIRLFNAQYSWITSKTDIQLQKLKKQSRLLNWARYYDFETYEIMFVTLTSANTARMDIRDFLRNFKRSMKRKRFPLLSYAWVLELGKDNTHPHYHCVFVYKKVTNDRYKKFIKYSYYYSTLFWGNRCETQKARKPKHSLSFPAVGYLLNYFNKQGKDSVVSNWRNFNCTRPLVKGSAEWKKHFE